MKRQAVFETDFDCPNPAYIPTQEVVARIVHRATALASFWSASHGWAPEGAANLLARSRLDRLESMSRCLALWTPTGSELESEGRLILAWANLGALVEALLKLLLAVHHTDYAKKPLLARDGTPRDPDAVQLEDLRQFYARESILPEWKEYVATVQSRRNAIHFFRSREIGAWSEFHSHIALHLGFMRALDRHLPYPEET